MIEGRGQAAEQRCRGGRAGRVRLAAVILAATALAGCGSPSKRGGFYQDDGPPDKVPADVSQTPDAVPRVEPFHPYANRPYTALGRSYTPMTEDRPLNQRGKASWYGRQFHGNRTASGERYDMFAMSAAHPTMPLPSYARVTNLRNGASVVVRVNDRGPFLSDRIIDLSYAAAMRLGIAGPGTGEVEVERLTYADIRAGRFGGGPFAAAPAPAPSPAPASPSPLPPLTVASSGGPWSVQLGAFEIAANAQSLRDRIALLLSSPEADALPAATRQPRVEHDDGVYRVLVGMLPDRSAAVELSERLRRFLDRETALYLRR
jgi:rare lipoprotein A